MHLIVYFHDYQIPFFINALEAGLGLPDTDAWHMIETIAGKNNIGYKHIVSKIHDLSKQVYHFILLTVN